MTAYIVRRLFSTIVVMAVVAFVVFSLLYLTPGDPAAVIAGDIATDEDIRRIHAQLGLDEPFLLRFGGWLGALLHADFGTSIFTNLPVTQLIAQRVEPTVSLTLCTLVVAILIAVPLGVVAAAKAGTWLDRAVMSFSVLGFSVPVFVIAYALILGFAVQLDWLPVQGYRSLRDGFWDWLRHLVLPSVALGTVYVALIARMTRASMLDVLAQDYIRTASAKGLAPNQVLTRHALKNAAIPVITIIGMGVALLISGAIVTETVFALPGIGRLTVDAILVVMIAMAIFAPWLGTIDPQLVFPIKRLRPPSATSWFGTDMLGRDVYSRVIYGARVSLVVGLAVALLSTLLGLAIGLVTGYLRRLDAVVMRIMDGLMSIPSVLLAIALMALTKASMGNVIVAITIAEVPRVVRLVRSLVLTLREQPYVEAAIASGTTLSLVLLRHILPNIVAPLLVQGTYVCGSAMITEAILSFIGAGTPPNIPSWGNIMAEGRSLVQIASYLIIFPGIFLSLTVLAVNLLGDGMRDALDPRLARRM